MDNKTREGLLDRIETLKKMRAISKRERSLMGLEISQCEQDIGVLAKSKREVDGDDSE